LARCGMRAMIAATISFVRDTGSVNIVELVAIDRVDYIRRAAALGSDPAQLSTLRERLARQLAGARLFDMKRYARAFEAALSAMHDRYLHGLAPDHIAVNDDMLSQR